MAAPALLVIDIQRGAFDGERCPPIARADELVAHAVSLVAAARAGGVPVIFVQHGEAEPGSPFETGSPNWALHAELTPQPGDPVIGKAASSAFEGTALGATLQGLGAQDLVLCGLQSEFCVSNTARSALELGYTVHIARDGHSTWPFDGKSAEAISEAANDDLAARGARLAPTAELASRLRTQG